MSVTVVKNNSGALNTMQMVCPVCSSILRFTAQDSNPAPVINRTDKIYTVTCPSCQSVVTKTVNNKIHELAVQDYDFNRLPI